MAAHAGRFTLGLSSVQRFAKANPLAFGMGVSLIKTSACDLMVQKVLEKREAIDWKRNATFASFGLLYLGGVQYCIYVPVFSRLFPNAAAFAAKPLAQKARDLKGIRDCIAQVFLDAVVHHAIMYFPTFYMIKELVAAPDGKPSPSRALHNYSENISDDMLALWKIWIPAQLLNFSLMPMYLRIPWSAAASALWTSVLSAMRGGEDVPVAPLVGSTFDAKAMELYNRTYFLTPPPLLDKAQTHLVVVAHASKDRPGIIKDLAGIVAQSGGGISTSKMIVLGPGLSIMMHVALPPAALSQLKSALSNAALPGVEVACREIEPGEDVSPPAWTGNVRLTGEARPGLLFALSELLASHGLNIEHLQTERHYRSGGEALKLGDYRTAGQVFFTASGRVSAPRGPNVKAVQASLKELEQDQNVVAVLEPTSRLRSMDSFR